MHGSIFNPHFLIAKYSMKKREENEKAGSHRESNPGHLVCAVSVLPLSYNNQLRTTSSQSSVYQKIKM